MLTIVAARPNNAVKALTDDQIRTLVSTEGHDVITHKATSCLAHYSSPQLDKEKNPIKGILVLDMDQVGTIGRQVKQLPRNKPFATCFP